MHAQDMNKICAKLTLLALFIVVFVVAGPFLSAGDTDGNDAKNEENVESRPVSSFSGGEETGKKGSLVVRRESSKLKLRKDTSSQTMRQMSSWMIVILVIGGVGWIYLKKCYPRFGIAGSNSKQIQIVERKALTPKKQLILIQVGNKNILIADSGTRVNYLCDVEPVEDGFGQILDGKLEQASEQPDEVEVDEGDVK